MNRWSKAIPIVMRALIVSAALAAPVLAVPAAHGDTGAIIEAPAPAKSGLGLVILVMLQR